MCTQGHLVVKPALILVLLDSYFIEVASYHLNK